MLKNLLLLAASVSSLSFSSFAAAAECTLNGRELKSALNLKAKYYKSKSPVVRDVQSVRQSVVLKSDQQVAYEAGGCEHYSYSFKYIKAPADLSAMSNVDLAKFAIELLKSTPVVASKKPEKTVLRDAIRSALEEGLINKTDLILQCGDAVCGLSVEEDNTLVLSYSFAL